MSVDKKTVIILGMHRSGTSMVAGVVNQLGVHLGDDLLGNNPSNPFGHYEDIDFLEINKKILSAAGGNWSEPPERDQIYLCHNDFEQRISALVKRKRQDSNERPWGWKDPRTCLTLGLFIQDLENPYLIVCYRHIEDIVKSLMQRNKFRYAQSKKLVDIYTKRIQEFLDENPDLPVIKIQYEDMVRKPESFVLEINSFLDLREDPIRINQAVKGIASKSQLDRKKLAQKVRIFVTMPARLMRKVFNQIRTGLNIPR